MLKASIAVIAMLLGGAATGVAVYVQSRPEAFTTRTSWLDAGVVPVNRLARTAIGDAAAKPPLYAVDEIVLPTVVVAARAPRLTLPKEPVPVTRPCSEWREIGPETYVRTLCP
jgi:hypothetical protein